MSVIGLKKIESEFIMNDQEINVYKLVKKLLGEINPVGETHTDTVRLENLKETCHLVDKLLHDIDTVIPNKRRSEYSMKKAGEYADEFFDAIGIQK